MYQKSMHIETNGRGSYEITGELESIIKASKVSTGLCNVFIRHTSASLIICENADPVVRQDLDRYFSRLVVDGDPLFEHTAEGEDDMPAHIRSILTQTSTTLPIDSGRSALGVWQGVFVYEHRLAPQRRNIVVTIHN